MKKLTPLFLCVVLLFILSACSSSSRLHTESINADQTEQTIPVTEAPPPPPPSEETASDTKEPPIKELQIRVEGEDGQNIVFQLNNSSAAHAPVTLTDARSLRTCTSFSLSSFATVVAEILRTPSACFFFR